MIDVSDKRRDAHSNKGTMVWNIFGESKFLNKAISAPILSLHFWAWYFKKEWANFDRFHVQELKPETIGRNGGNESNISCILAVRIKTGVPGLFEFFSK